MRNRFSSHHEEVNGSLWSHDQRSPSSAVGRLTRWERVKGFERCIMGHVCRDRHCLVIKWAVLITELMQAGPSSTLTPAWLVRTTPPSSADQPLIIHRETEVHCHSSMRRRTTDELHGTLEFIILHSFPSAASGCGNERPPGLFRLHQWRLNTHELHKVLVWINN